jgi:hypothetical protein
MSPLLALSVIRRTAIFLDAIGGIADIGRRWREMVMTLMTRSGQNKENVKPWRLDLEHYSVRTNGLVG